MIFYANIQSILLTGYSQFIKVELPNTKDRIDFEDARDTEA